MNYTTVFTSNLSAVDVKVKEIVCSRKIDSNLEDACAEAWQKKVETALEQGQQLWDSELYRFERAKLKDGILDLKISTIPFSSRFGMNECTELISKLGIDYAPLGIFTSCFVWTSDGKMLFIKKSLKYLSNRPHRASFIGGVLSKSEKIIKSGEDMFKEVLKEIKEETSLEAPLDALRLRAGYITENYNFCLVFEIHLEISAAEAEIIFSAPAGKIGDGEALALVVVDTEHIPLFVEQELLPRDIPKFEILGMM